MTTLHNSRVYPHPPEKLWRALTDSELLAKWFMQNDFEARVGHRFTFRTDPAPGFDGVVRCEVLALEPLRKLEFSWAGGPIDTVVSWELEPVDGGTRLTVTQRGFQGARGFLVSRILKGGNKKIYGQWLPALLDAMDGQGQAKEFAPMSEPHCEESGLRNWLSGLFSWSK